MEVSGSSRSLEIPLKRPKVSDIPDTGAATPEPAPPVFNRKLRKAAVGTGCDIRLRVSVAGHPKPVLTWYHNDDPVPPSEAQDPGGLWIRDCGTSDAGLYTCVATNDLGEASCSAVLAIMDLGEDSEATEDETTEPQMETKEGAGRHQDKAGQGGPPGEGGKLMNSNQDSTDRRATLPGTHDPVVERELRTLGSRPPGTYMDPTNLARTQTVKHSIGQRSTSRVPLSSPEPPLSMCNPYQELQKPKPLKTDQSPRVSTSTLTQKLVHAGPKISDKVRAYEERRGSTDPLRGAASSLGRAASLDSDDSGQKTGGPNKQDERILQGAAQKRVAFKQRASSLEDKISYSQRVQNYQSKFTEELQRIKKMVVKPSLKKAYSTEQLSQNERIPVKVEPIPPQVVKKLEARERALEEGRGGGSRRQVHATPKDKELLTMAKPNLQGRPLDTLTGGLSGGISVAMDTPSVHQLPRQPVPTVTRTNLTRNNLQISSVSDKDLLVTQSSSSHNSLRDQRTSSKGDTESDMKVGSRSLSPTGKLGIHGPPKPPRLNSSPTQSVSPLLKRRKAEVGRTTTSPNVRVNIPTILVEDEPMRTEGTKDRTKRKEGKVRRSRSSAQPMSPTEGPSSDDSYQSADEDPVEAPRFQRPLQATAAAIGSEVTLKCVITGNPPPTVMWRKDDMEISHDAGHVLKASGEEHSLVIKQMSLNDVGSYGVTAVSAAGRAFCSTALNVQPEWTYNTQHGKPALSLDISSPIQSDEEYLSPQEEAMEVTDSTTALTPSVLLREAPSFEVVPCDQEISEGDDIVVSVKVKGQPKPMTYWSKDGVAAKTAGRFTLRETHDGAEELRISPGQTSDSGLYMCKIINEYGSRQAEFRVEVTAQTSLKITREVNNMSARAGESAMFECHIVGPSDVDVDWLSNGKLIQPALLNCKMHFDGKRCRLLLNSVHEDDSGTYTCKLSTAKEELTSSANLQVTPSKEPLFTRKLDILEVIEGRTARFNCKVSGSPPPQVTWMHFETRVEESDNVHILQEGGRHSLVINHVSSDTEGFYTAIGQNIYGKSECTAELYVQESRAAISSHMAKLEKMPSIPEEPEGMESEVEKRTMPDFVTPLADIEVIEGKEAVLECKVAGLPYPTIAWYHNGKRIESSEECKKTQYGDVHHLVIRTTCHSHGGVYKAVISNKVGKATCYAHLYVTDIVPDAPDGPPVIDAITGKTISLSWKKPKRADPSFDTCALLYVVQQQPLGSTQWTVIATNLKETNYTVTSLSKGVRYAFRVLTSTGKTQSRPSPSTDLVQLLDRGPYLRKAPVFLDKPDVVYVVENQPASITVTLNHVQAVVTWKRRGVALASKPGMYEMSMPDDDQHTLKLQRVKSADLGQLVVMASNQFGSDLCTLQLTMAVRPKFETIMEDVDVQVGDTSRLAVVVEGKPDPDILWYKDDVLLCESSHFTFVYDDPEYSLVILNARPEHSGVYTCTAKNLAGSNSCKAELTIHTERKEELEPMEDEGSILRKMRRLTDYYDVHKEIGRGAFSYVKRVTEKKTKAEFAAKFTSARGRRKVLALREMDLLSELDHERILYFHDAFEKKDVMVIITELCHEEFLERIAKRTTVTELEIRSTVQQVLGGLDYLHQKNIVHLDIKPENILMSRPGSDQIRICDYGNAIKLESSDQYYCKYGTPEFVAPEIVNQTPVSTATDIWPVGVITYLCLTGVSPFAGENDRATALNIRNYNVAFEESMFADLCKEARGFVIKLMVVDRLRPSATECLRHPWFKSPRNKTISTSILKQVLSRRKWQRSLISYKAKMVMRSIPELLNESSNHVSIAVSRHLKEGSEQLSSSSDSDADVDELPFIPMPLSMVFSGSRVSLNEISGDGDVSACHSASTGGTGNKENMEVGSSRGRKPERLADEEEATSGQKMVETKGAPLRKGASVEAEESETKARRATMRRGSSADSALLHIDTEEEKATEESEKSNKNLKKSVSMELPNRSPSPGAAKLSQEDYALKLELMRQRLLRGGSMDKKMSGLRGPLFETLGIDDQSQTGSLDRNLRRSRAGPSTITRAASSDTPSEDTPKTKVFKKSISFTQGDSEPMPLHRRFGEPLEIPSTGSATNEGKKLKEATSMSALTEQTTLKSTSTSPTRKASFVLPTNEEDQQQKQNHVREHGGTERTSRTSNSDQTHTVKSESMLSPVIPPIIVTADNDEAPNRQKKKELDIHKNDRKENGKMAQNSKPLGTIQKVLVQNQTTDSSAAGLLDITLGNHPPALSEHPAVFAKVATADQSPTAISSSPNASVPRQVMLRTDIKDIDSEEIFEARFKKRESSLTRGIRKLTRNKSDEKSPILSRKTTESGEEVYRPGPRGAPIEMVASGLQAKSKSVQDLREDDKETGLSLIGRFSLRNKRSTNMDKKVEKTKEDKAQGVQESAVGKRVSWAVGRSKSLDTNEQRPVENRELRKEEESSVSAMRRRFESKVAGISAKLRSQSKERNNKDADEGQKELVQRKEVKKATDSPILAMRQRFENKVSEISTIIRSQSEERKGETEGKRTPLFSRHRHSQSEGRGAQGMGIPENQLAQQAGTSASRESNESVSSFQSDKGSDSDRRSRWDRWGLTRGKKDKTSSQPDLPSSSTKKEGQFVRTASDFAPVFHIKLKDQILLEGESVTLTCLPAGSPHPEIMWMKDRKPLELNDRINLMSHPDGRQLLTVMKSSRRDTGIYECVATNPIATVTTSCTLSIACVPKRPGTPEVPQTYDTTALVLWKPADTKPPCSYTLERKKEGDSKWLTVVTGVVDCYYNVTNLPQGDTFRFRVSCVNRAGQGPHSNQSAPVCMKSTGGSVSPAVAAVKTVPTPPVVTSSVVIPGKPVQSNPSRIIASTSSSPKDPSSFMLVQPVSSSSHPSTPIPTAAPVGRKIEKANETVLSHPSSPTVKSPPPFVLPKPQSPVNVVTPMTQTTSVFSTPPHLVTPSLDHTKPAVSSVLVHVPTATVTARVAPKPVSPTQITPCVAPTPVASTCVAPTVVAPSSLAPIPVTPTPVAPNPVTFTPQVLQLSSLSPIGESVRTSSRGTPSAHTTPSTVLRQGVPQKPYTFLEEKARGRFGVIRECRENSTGKIFMAKIIPYSQENKPEILKEYEILKSLHNDKVMSLHEAYVTPRYLVLVSEYCTGKELLYSLIERFRYSEDDVVGYLVQLLQGVEYLHSRRVLHLDLKPDNIMVTNLNTIKIVDLGSAQSFNPLSLKQQDSRRGTLEYMAPEMVKGEVLGPPADVWTVGVVTFIMLSGRLPFEDKDPLKVESKILMAKFEPAKLYPNVSQSACAFLKKMLSSYPWARATTRDCFAHAWLQDSYLMKLRRQTLTFTSNRLKEFLVEQQCRRTADATKHKVLLRTYQSSPQSPALGTAAPADVK